jgi:IgA Peptidase M64
MRARPPKILVVLAVGAMAAYGLSQTTAFAAATPSSPPTELREVFEPGGSIEQVRVPVTRVARPLAVGAAVTADVSTIQQTGVSDQRFDLVFVGDGYTAAEQGLFHDQAVARWGQLSAIEPFKSLKNNFNVWEVDAVSRESGVDNDPTNGVQKDTALNGEFWCAGLDRLACVNDDTALQYAALAPQVDQALVLVNSTTYGGSGGRVTVSSGGNSLSGDIVAHELGHSIGGLADEYGGTGTYTGGELTEPNSSIANEATMRAQGSKWAAYLGKATPDGGVIGTFEGSSYFDQGVFRPSENSIMRSLGRPFNLIGVDALRAAILRESSTP